MLAYDPSLRKWKQNGSRIWQFNFLRAKIYLSVSSFEGANNSTLYEVILRNFLSHGMACWC